MAKSVYVIDGNVGAGKSSVGERLHATGKLAFLPEPVEQWREGFASNLLDCLYSDSTRWTFTFQICAFITRAKTWREILARTDRDIVLMERSVWTDRSVFAELGHLLGNMNDTERQVYNGLWDFLAGQWAVRPQATFYLRTPATVCLERITERGRAEEQGIDLGFLSAIEKLHDDWLMDEHDGPVVVLDGRKSVSELASEIWDVVGE